MKRDLSRKTKAVSLSGIIIPVEWDKRGKPLSFAISTFDETDYLIVQQGKNNRMQQYMGEKVKVYGTVDDEDGVSWISVKAIERI